MAGNISGFQAVNISFLKIFLYGVKNAGPQYETPKNENSKNAISVTLN